MITSLLFIKMSSLIWKVAKLVMDSNIILLSSSAYFSQHFFTSYPVDYFKFSFSYEREKYATTTSNNLSSKPYLTQLNFRFVENVFLNWRKKYTHVKEKWWYRIRIYFLHDSYSFCYIVLNVWLQSYGMITFCHSSCSILIVIRHKDAHIEMFIPHFAAVAIIKY